MEKVPWADYVPRLPIVQTAGHNPTTLLEPGKVTEVSTNPSVKQNLFQVYNSSNQHTRGPV